MNFVIGQTEQLSQKENQGVLSRGYFDIQLAFAKKVAAIDRRTLTIDDLMKYTQFYRVITGEKYQKNKKIAHSWKQFEVQFASGQNLIDLVYSKYLERIKLIRIAEKATFLNKKSKRNFTYTIEEKDGIKKASIHFSIKSREGLRDWQTELIDVLTKIRKDHPEVAIFQESSWLLSERLFKRILENLGIRLESNNLGGFSSLSWWGQFITIAGGYNAERGDEFLANLASATNWEELVHAFPMPVMKITMNKEKVDELIKRRP